MKSVNKSSNRLCCKKDDQLNPKFSSDFINNYEDHKLMFERLLNNKNKFKLDNHFDKNNCQMFLSEKEKYLSEIIMEDEDFKSGDEIPEKNKSKIEILMPNGAPSKFTFGQY